jgi:hypothetical protein
MLHGEAEVYQIATVYSAPPGGQKRCQIALPSMRRSEIGIQTL